MESKSITFLLYTLTMRIIDTMHKRINITLPEQTVHLIDRFVKKGERSTLINQAVQIHLSKLEKKKIREGMKESAIKNAERDRRLAEEWFTLTA